MEIHELQSLSRAVSTSNLAPDWLHKSVTTNQRPGQQIDPTLTMTTIHKFSPQVALRELNLDTTVITVDQISVACPRLESLNLTGNIDVTDAGLNNLLSRWGGSLKVLDLARTHISGEQMTANCPKLESLNLFGCEKLSGTHLNSLLKKWASNLTTLDLAFIKISGEEISVSCPHLKKLNLSLCICLTSKGLKNLLKQFGSHLRELELRIIFQGLDTSEICKTYPHLNIIM